MEAATKIGIMPEKRAVTLAGLRPIWGAMIILDLGGNCRWYNSEGWRPEINKQQKPCYKNNYNQCVPCSFGNNHPTRYQVVDVDLGNEILIDESIHFASDCK